MKIDINYILLVMFFLIASFLWGQVAVLQEKVSWLESQVLELVEPSKKLYQKKLLEE